MLGALFPVFHWNLNLSGYSRGLTFEYSMNVIAPPLLNMHLSLGQSGADQHLQCPLWRDPELIALNRPQQFFLFILQYLKHNRGVQQ